MAPEQISGEAIDERTDVYGLGVLLFDLLTGALPFDCTTATTVAELEEAFLHSPPPAPSERVPTSAALDAVVLKCLEKAPANRFPTVLAFLRALKQAIDPSAEASLTLAEPVEVLGVFIELRTLAGARPGDDDFEVVAAAIRAAEAELEEAGFLLPMVGPSSILGAHPGSTAWSSPVESAQMLENLARTAQAIRAELGSAAARLHLNVCLHLGRVDLQRTEALPRIEGGPLLKVRTWAPNENLDGVCATEQASAVLGLSGKRAGGFWRVAG
jgi:serine/threonine-protein kinase